MDSRVWICGRLIGEWDESGFKWSFHGAFHNRESAVNACKDEKYFIFSTDLDKVIPEQTMDNVSYPVIEAALAEENI
jgi:predicted esterase